MATNIVRHHSSLQFDDENNKALLQDAQLRDRLIVFGYIQMNFKQYIPMEILRLCLLFFDEKVYWIFDGNNLQKLLTMKCGEYIDNTTEIKYNDDLSFYFRLYPNGHIASYKGFIHLCLFIKSWSKCIDYSIVSLTINCKELEMSSTHLCKIKKIGESRKMSKAMSIFDNQYDLQQLTLCCNIKMVSIKYKSTDKILYYPSKSSLKLNENIQFEWNINKALLSRFKDWRNCKIYYSPIFNNWYFGVAPNGGVERYKGRFQFGLGIFIWPIGIEKIKIKSIIKCNYNHKEHEYSSELKIGSKTTFQCSRNGKTMEKIKDELWIKVNITILEIYDEYGSKIRKNDWNLYGIIQNN